MQHPNAGQNMQQVCVMAFGTQNQENANGHALIFFLWLLFSFFDSYFLSLAIFHAKKSHVFGEIGAGIQQV